MSAERPNLVYEFGPYRLEPREHRLVRDGRSISLTGKAFETLKVLVERHGMLVTKQELMAAVWPEITVEENNLDRNISTLRKALGDSPTGYQFIETVPRKGYRFVAPVTEKGAKPQAVSEFHDGAPIQRQEIRFCTTRDRVRVAYSRIGSGHPLVKVANCFNHLDFEWESPIWRHWVRDLASGHSIVRYDGRCNGLADWDVEDVSFEAWVHDLETVADAAGLEKFALMGISQGAPVAIAYAVRHPERVSHLILCGGYAEGVVHRGRPEAIEVRRALETLVQLNWGEHNPKFFEMVTNLYIPEGATPEDQEWFKQLQLKSVSPANLVKFMRGCDDINVRSLLPKVSVPTLIFHAERDHIAPPEQGRILATEIPGARYVPLPTGNHLLLASEPAWATFREELANFLRSESRATVAS